MILRIEIDTSNDAFQGDDLGRLEVSRLLREQAKRIDVQGMPTALDHWKIIDHEGNTSGSVRLEVV